VSDDKVRHARNHCVQREKPQNHVRFGQAGPMYRRVLTSKKLREEPFHGATALGQVHEHETEDHESNDGVIRRPRVTEILLGEETAEIRARNQGSGRGGRAIDGERTSRRAEPTSDRTAMFSTSSHRFSIARSVPSKAQ